VSLGLDSLLKTSFVLNQQEANFKTNERDEISSTIDKSKTLFTLNKFHKHLPQDLSIIIKNIINIINTIKLLLSFNKSHGEGGDICVQ
jgi:polysaccharide pyruvyl transferase WcaK-like protein